MHFGATSASPGLLTSFSSKSWVRCAKHSNILPLFHFGTRSSDRNRKAEERCYARTCDGSVETRLLRSNQGPPGCRDTLREAFHVFARRYRGRRQRWKRIRKLSCSSGTAAAN